MLRFHCQKPRFDPGLRTKIPTAQQKKATVNSLGEFPSALWELFANLWFPLRIWWPLALTSGWVLPAEIIVSQQNVETWGTFAPGQGKQAYHISTLTINPSIRWPKSILPPLVTLDPPRADTLPSSRSMPAVTNGTGCGQRVRRKTHPQDLRVGNKSVERKK